MNKIKKLKFKLFSAIFLLVGVSVVGLGYGVKAYQNYGDSPKVVVEGNYIEAQNGQLPIEQNLGAVASYDVNSLWFGVNGDIMYHIVAPFSQTSSTIVSFVNPFGTSSYATVSLAHLDFSTAASSSLTATTTVSCGAASTAYGSPSLALVSSDAFGVSTTPVIENNITSSLGPTVGGGSVTKVMLTPTYPYFTCVASNSCIFGSSAVVGKATVRVSHTR